MGVIAPQNKHTREYFETGSVALDGSNPTTVTTGFSTITMAIAGLEDAVAPGVGTSLITAVPTNVDGASTVDIYAWKPTSNSDPTLVASTGTETVHWIASGY